MSRLRVRSIFGTRPATIKLQWLSLAAILALAFVLRGWNLQSQSNSMDEVYELRLAQSAPAEIIWKSDGFPPLYHLLLHGWYRVFPADSAGRWFSLTAGMLGVVVAWLWGRAIGGAAAAAWTALLLAMSPIHIFYSQEIRAYPLVFLVASLAMLGLFRALDTDRWRDWLWFASATIVGVYVHYHLVFVGLLAVPLILWQRRIGPSLRRALAAYGLIVLACLPSLMLLRVDLDFQVAYGSRTPFSFMAWGYSYFSFMSGFSLGPSQRELHSALFRQVLPALIPWLLLVGVPLVVLAWNGWTALGNSVWRGRLVMFALAAPLVIGLFGELLGLGYNVRYVFWCLLPTLAILAAGIPFGSRHKAVWVAVGLLIVTSLTAISNRHADDRYHNEDALALAAYLGAADRQAPVFVTAAYMARPVRYYLPSPWPVHPLPDAGADGSGLVACLATIRDRTVGYDRCFLVYSRAFHSDPAGRLRDWLTDREGARLEAEFAGIQLYRLEVPLCE